MAHTETLVYEGPGGVFEGTISRPDDTPKNQHPGVLVVHAFGGQGPFDTDKAEQLASIGYVALAVDLYGQGRRGRNPEESRALMAELTADRALLRDRMLSALNTLQSQKDVDPARTAAIGFCFGGKAVLDLARSGSDICGVASFHGVYDPPNIPNADISAKVLLLHGWDDPLATPAELLELTGELDAAKADWELCAFGGTGHAFTNPKAASPADGMAYHPRNDRRAWARLQAFLRELFGE